MILTIICSSKLYKYVHFCLEFIYLLIAIRITYSVSVAQWLNQDYIAYSVQRFRVRSLGNWHEKITLLNYYLFVYKIKKWISFKIWCWTGCYSEINNFSIHTQRDWFTNDDELSVSCTHIYLYTFDYNLNYNICRKARSNGMTWRMSE